jgi:hypothetical protein
MATLGRRWRRAAPFLSSSVVVGSAPKVFSGVFTDEDAFKVRSTFRF